MSMVFSSYCFSEVLIQEPSRKEAIQEPTDAKTIQEPSQPRRPSERPCKYVPGKSPEMVLLQGGEFTMGSPSDEVGRQDSEGPQHKVLVQPFAIGRCEVTVGEFLEFVDSTQYKTQIETEGCFYRNTALSDIEENPNVNRLALGFDQQESSPVTCVSWYDAQAYVLWLSMATGVVYRLPSEAEWEYAARAGTQSPFSTGECINTQQANFDPRGDYGSCDLGATYLGRTQVVASYDPNNWGLYDMHGNVLEWVDDCWHDSYDGAPTDGRAWLEDDSGYCAYRVLRGGSSGNAARFQRSADRGVFYTDVRNKRIGFRLARTLSNEGPAVTPDALAE